MSSRHLFAALLIATSSTVVLADQCKPDCGRITGIEHFERQGEGSGVGAVAGGVAGALLGNQLGKGSTKTIATVGGAAGGAYLGNVVEKKVKSEKMLKISVKLDSGKTQTVDVKDESQFATGDRVQVHEGKLKRYTGN